MQKTLTSVDMERTYHNIVKAIYDKPTANIILNGEELKFRKETKMLTLTISIQYHIGSLSHRNQTRKKK